MKQGRYIFALWLAVLTLFSGVTAGAAEPIDGFEDNGFLVEEAYNQGRGEVQHTLNIHMLLEWVGEFEEKINDQGKKERDFKAILSPGIRAAIVNKDGLQTVVGVGIPIGVTGPADNYGVFLYFSVEHKLF